MELRRFAVPEPEPGEVLVEVLGCTVCGSDLHSLALRRPVPLPTVLGHEAAGRVRATGGSDSLLALDGTPVRAGDRIIWTVVASCGACLYCRSDLPQKCRARIKYGHEAIGGGRELKGGLAERVLLAPGTGIVRLPADMPLELACPASCATATVFAVMEAVGAVPEGRFCVLGAGMLGLTGCAALRSLGAGSIVCLEPREERRQLAMRMGASAAHPPDALPELALEQNGGEGFDAILDLAGVPDLLMPALKALRQGGRLVLAGSVRPAPPAALAMEYLVTRQLTVHGIHNYGPRHLVRAADFLAWDGALPLRELVGAWFPLSRINEAIEAAQHHIRVGVRPNGL